MGPRVTRVPTWFSGSSSTWGPRRPRSTTTVSTTGRRASTRLTNEARKLPAAKFTAKIAPGLIIARRPTMSRKTCQNKEIQFLDSRTVKRTRAIFRAARHGYIAASSPDQHPYEYAWKDHEAAKKAGQRRRSGPRRHEPSKDAAGITKLAWGLDPKKRGVDLLPDRHALHPDLRRVAGDGGIKRSATTTIRESSGARTGICRPGT